MYRQDMQQESVHKMDILLWYVFKLFVKNKKRILEKLDLTCSQFEILDAMHYLQSIQPEVIQVDLSEKTSIDPMSTSTILRNLQRKGLVTRTRSTMNARTVIVALTPAGGELLEKANQEVKASNELIYKDLNKKYLVSQLVKLSDRLNKFNY